MAGQDARRAQRHHAVALILLLLVTPARAQDEEAPPPDLTLQDKTKTPGKVRPLSKKTICSTKWGIDKRFVTAKMKLGVYHDYGLSGPKDDACVQDKHGRSC
jgi:hypothetical protein